MQAISFFSLTFFYFAFLLIGYSQKTPCAFGSIFQQELNSNPFFKEKIIQVESEIRSFRPLKSDSILRIPVVFHIIYRNSEQNISNRQILSQLEVLNEDYRRKNKDTSITLAEFPVADTKIEFCLAGKDLEGNDFSGVTRIQTAQAKIGQSKQLYQLQPVWDRNRYLNIYVCEIGDGVAGYSAFPGADSAKDAVVIDYTNFGRIGNLSPDYELGRTTTHEVGHWLGLYHIWGKMDSSPNCNDDDLVQDTPNQDVIYTKCPQNPKYSCSSKDMLSNYMGYVQDKCMAAFTLGQAERMRSMIHLFRPELLQAMPCAERLPIDSVVTIPTHSLRIFPNPGYGEFKLNSKEGYMKKYSFELYSIEGKKMPDMKLENVSDTQATIKLKSPAGIYLLKVKHKNNFSIKKILLVEPY